MSDRTLIAAFEDEFHRYQRMSEQAMAQLDEAALHEMINPLQNSIAVIAQHVAGNLLSRFTDFLSTDGEKPTRDRDSEFADHRLTSPELMDLWTRGWNCLFAAITPLRDSDLLRIVHIRAEPHTIQKALARASAHCAWHAAQIALIAKHLKGDAWQYLTIPPHGSQAFNEKLRTQPHPSNPSRPESPK